MSGSWSEHSRERDEKGQFSQTLLSLSSPCSPFGHFWGDFFWPNNLDGWDPGLVVWLMQPSCINCCTDLASMFWKEGLKNLTTVWQGQHNSRTELHWSSFWDEYHYSKFQPALTLNYSFQELEVSVFLCGRADSKRMWSPALLLFKWPSGWPWASLPVGRRDCIQVGFCLNSLSICSNIPFFCASM